MGLLRRMGFTNVRVYTGGMADWTGSGGPVEMSPAAVTTDSPGAQAPETPPSTAAGDRGVSVAMRRLGHSGDAVLGLLDSLAGRSVGHLLLAWIGMATAFGVLYWATGLAAWGGLIEGGVREPATLSGLVSSLYFSFITAMSVGYGDIVPAGPMRILAVAEAAAGLLLFGFIIAKFVSRRQEQVIDEIHRIAFEDRLGRVQTGLHLALSEMQAIVLACGAATDPPPRMLARAESATMVFSRELRSVHDLLYRPQQAPDEEALEAVLVSLAAAFREVNDLVACLSVHAGRSGALQRSLGSISRLGSEICGDCVPSEHAPALKEWMDQIQGLAKRLATS